MPQTLAAVLTILLSISAGGDTVSPPDVVEAMRSCVPIVQVDQVGEQVLFHVDTPDPSGGVVTWVTAERLANWENYRLPQQPDIVLLFARQPENDQRPGIRANRDRIATCFTSLTL